MQQLSSFISRLPGTEEAYEEILGDPEIAKAIEAHGIDRERIPAFISDLDDYLLNRAKCRGCLGLDGCKQPVKGHAPLLKPQSGMLKVGYGPCHFERSQQHLNNIKSFHMPAEIFQADFKNFFVEGAQRREVRDRAISFIHDYSQGIIGKGLYLHGSFGTGKTYILSAIASTLSRMGVTCGLVYFPELIAEIKAGFGNNDSSYEKVEQLKNMEVLMLDDIGSEAMTSWMRDEVLGRILNYRMQRQLPTFFTSNMTYQALRQHYSYSQKGEVEEMKGARILERIMALSTPVELKGKNYRNK